MPGTWQEGSVVFEWDGDFEPPHTHVVSGQWAINYGQEDGAELTTIRNDVVIDRARVAGDSWNNGLRVITILDADAEPMFVLEQENGQIEQVFSLTEGERRLRFSHVTWTLAPGDDRENDEFVCEDHREMAGISLVRP